MPGVLKPWKVHDDSHPVLCRSGRQSPTPPADALATATVLRMLNRIRQTAPTVALLICVALLATWLTGAHAHRHVGGHEHEQSLHAWGGVASGHEMSHGHELDSAHTVGHDLGTAGHREREHFDPHSIALIHADGHENVEMQALQPPVSKTLSDLPLLVLFCCAVLVLTRTRTPVLAVITDPPDPKRADWSLRPPLRGPPLFSVA